LGRAFIAWSDAGSAAIGRSRSGLSAKRSVDSRDNSAFLFPYLEIIDFPGALA